MREQDEPIVCMPDEVRAQCRQAVESAAWKVHANWRYRSDGIWNIDDLKQEAWAIAANRWPRWKTKGYAYTDTFMHLSNRVRDLARDQEGLKRDLPDHPKNFTSTCVPWQPEWFTDTETDPWSEPRRGHRPHDGLNVGNRIGRNRRWARTFMRRYRQASRDYFALARRIESKPPTLSSVEHSKRVERARAVLAQRYAELISEVDRIEGVA